MMFKYWNDVFRTSLFEQPGPRLGIIFLGLESRNEVFVSESVLRAVGCDVMLVFVRTLVVHVARIPFVSKRWNGINAPVNEDPELRVLVPFGNCVGLERLPIGAKWPGGNPVIHAVKERGARRVIFRASLLPSLVYDHRILTGRGLGGGRRLGTQPRWEQEDGETSDYRKEVESFPGKAHDFIECAE